MAAPNGADGYASSLKNEKEKVDTSPSLESAADSPNPSGITEKALLRKLDLKLLPPLTLLYLLSFLDRSNSE